MESRDMVTGMTVDVFNGRLLDFAVFSPDGKRVATESRKTAQACLLCPTARHNSECLRLLPESETRAKMQEREPWKVGRSRVLCRKPSRRVDDSGVTTSWRNAGASDRNTSYIVVAFRGTDPTHLQDLLADARVHKVPGPLGEVHRGFLHAFELVKDDVFNAIARWRDKNNPHSLWCTGHSLGAALAVVAVAHLLADGQTVNGLYNFGQPRVGNAAFAAEFTRRFPGRHFRFVNNNDSVTLVPPREFGYHHTGELRYIDSSGHIQTDMGSWHRFLALVTGRMEDFLKLGTDGF